MGSPALASRRWIFEQYDRQVGADTPLLPLFSGVLAEDLLTLALHEKTVSIDTTAAGGNASLMTLTER